MSAGYVELHDRVAWTDLTGRGKIKVLGEDRARLLHALTTNEVQRVIPGDGCYAYFLNALGRILADVNIVVREDFILLDTEPQTAAKVLRHLDQYIIADDVTLEDLTGEWATLAIEGPDSERVLRGMGAAIPGKPLASAEFEGGLVVRASYTGAPGFFLMGDQTSKAGWISRMEKFGAAPGDLEAFEVVRIEYGKPRYGVDLSERFLAQEANQSRALNFNKGCYLGQEIVERVRSRGQVHRLLMPLDAETQTPFEAGRKLELEGVSVAEVTSSRYSPAKAKTVALAYVRTERAIPGSELLVDGIPLRIRNPYQPG